MIRTNLSTRPFYNERAVHVVAALVGIVVLAITAWQVSRIVTLSQEKTTLNASIRRDQGEIDGLARRAADIRRGLNQKDLAAVAAQAKEANELIDARTFSWTALFNELEATLPEDVMLMSVHPEIKDGRTTVNLEIQGRRSEDIDSFFDRLEKTGRFHDVQWSNETVTDDGLHRMVMQAVYTPPEPSGPAVKPAAAPVPQKPGGRP